MALTSRRRAELRAEAHHLEPLAQVGNDGLTDAVAASIDDALRTHELVKIHVGRNTEVSTREIAALLADRVGADVVQVIGRTVTLFRENPELPHKPGAVPAWRRKGNAGGPAAPR